jgi:chorismate lyase/3-hydroxybenzoate synthase
MNAIALPTGPAAALVPRYVRDVDPTTLLGPRTLALLGFGTPAPATLADPRYLHIGLQTRDGAAWYEVWDAPTDVTLWSDGELRGARSGDLSFGWIEVSESKVGIAAATEHAYRDLLAHLDHSACPHLLRIWNYLDAITSGAGDEERYRMFCVGRAAGFTLDPNRFPAATAIGRSDGRRVLQMYWLSATQPGVPLENPRQIAAWRYPRRYGPRPPTFARAMLAPATLALPLMLSGTAAVVGHASLHAGDLAAQLDETLRNFGALIEAARTRQPSLPPSFGSGSLLKVYVSGRDAAASIEALLAARLAPEVPRLLLLADVCRTDLAVEIDGFHGG